MIFKKAQSSIEFMILVGVVIFFLVVFLGAIQGSMSDKLKEKQSIMVQDLASSVQDEINLASKSSDGYYRNFNIPEKINGRDYSIEILEEMVYVKTNDNKNALALPLASVTGNVVKGENIITKQNGEVVLNP
ncbi:MAG: hypothetical protein WC438_04795 [Candidatus Pacearchaeota archaeon]